LTLPLSDELQNAFAKARGQNSVRYLKIMIKNEKLELAGTGSACSLAIDFNGFQKNLSSVEPCYIAFRFKDAFANAPWALIMYTPDSCSVKEKMMYASSFATTRDLLGTKYFSKIKRYASPSEFIWNEFQNAESDDIEEGSGGSGGGDGGGEVKPKTVDPNKPWNKRELAIQQLEREEAQARQEMEQMATQKPIAVSGFSQVSFPLTPAAEEAVKDLIGGTYNWIQFSLDNPPKRFDVVTTKTIDPSELSGLINSVEPQFYLYRKDENITLIYCCPDKVSGSGFSSTLKNRMVYSTCKATFATSIKELGIPNIKKFDIRDPSELTETSLTAHLDTKGSSMFTGSELRGSPLATSSPVIRSTGAGFDNTQYRSNTPVFNRPGFNQSPHEGRGLSGSPNKVAQHKPGSLAGLMATTGTGRGNRTLPKGVVIPPSGAYC